MNKGYKLTVREAASAIFWLIVIIAVVVGAIYYFPNIFNIFSEKF